MVAGRSAIAEWRAASKEVPAADGLPRLEPLRQSVSVEWRNEPEEPPTTCVPCGEHGYKKQHDGLCGLAHQQLAKPRNDQADDRHCERTCATRSDDGSRTLLFNGAICT